MAFDKLDAEKGMEIRSPDGQMRWLKHPWSVLAWQIAGSDGLRLLHPEELDEERESAPAENLLGELLAIPAKDGLATLILIDEVLMYAREKVALDPEWRSRLLNFFQYLTQAATKLDTCAIVASLLATDPRKSDTLGKELTQELYAIFQRQREESVQPVGKDDAAEVLRRRFFMPASIRDHNSFKPHVIAAWQGMAALDEQAELTSLSADLLAPGALPQLWEGEALRFGQLIAYFSGTNVVQVQRTGYTEPVMIPRASREVLEEAVHAVVRGGSLWLIAGSAGFWQEEIPAGILTEDAILQGPPQAIGPKDLLPDLLPEAWRDGIATARSIADTLATREGKPLPWAIIRKAIDGAFASRLLERTEDSGL